MSLIRYPGGKNKIKREIIKTIKQFNTDIYVEPFCGALGIAIPIIKEQPPKSYSLINDKDYNIFAMWESVITYPTELIKKVMGYTPSVDSFREFKERLRHQKENIVQLGFMKLVIHQISYSGLGEKAGSPIGGFSQKKKKSNEPSDYLVGCRWNALRIEKEILTLHEILKDTECSCLDFEEVIRRSPGATFYLDPPYYIQGNALYIEQFSKSDHERLANSLKKVTNWVLSYDDCPQIRELYSFATIKELGNVSTINIHNDNNIRYRKELVIYGN